jgi:hypothetical protein
MATDGRKRARKQPMQTVAKSKRRRQAEYPAMHKAKAGNKKTTSDLMALASEFLNIV